MLETKVFCGREVLKSNLYVYILVRGTMTVLPVPQTQVAFKCCALFRKCVTNNDETTIVDANDLYLVMPMYNIVRIILT